MEVSMVEITGTLNDNLTPEKAKKMIELYEGLLYIQKQYEESRPILSRLEEKIDDTEGQLNLWKNRIQAETDPEKRMFLLEKIARFGTRMFMLKTIQNGQPKPTTE